MTMQNGPYVAVIEYDEEENAFHGRVVNLARDGFDFWGTNVEELKAEFAASADVYEEFCREQGREPEKPYSGSFLVRATPELHRAVAVAAAMEHKSMNAWVADTLRRATAEAAA